MLKNIYLKKNINVMMIGTEMKGKGGVAAVVNGYCESGIMSRQKIDYYESHCDGKLSTKIGFYLKNLIIIILNMNRYKIIHLHMASRWSFRRLLVIFLVAKFFRKKKVIHIHGAMFHIFYKKAIFFEKFLIMYTLSQADRIIVLSVEWKKRIETLCDKKKIVIISNSVPLQYEKSFKESMFYRSRKIILFLGEIGFRKGVYDLIEALSYIKDRNDFKAYLCGTGQIKKAMDKIKDYSLEKKVLLTGWIDGKEKNKLLKEAYLYVMPSYHEGLPMSILEAMATGTPVISTPVGGIPQILKNGTNGFIVPPRSPLALADCITKVLNEPDLWVKLSKNAYHTIKSKFSLEQTEKKLHNLYRSLI